MDFSEQEQSNRDKWYRNFLYRRGSKISKFDLEREMNSNDRKFDNLVSGSIKDRTVSNQEVVDKYREIDKWSKDRNLYETSQEAKVEVRVIMPSKYRNWK